MINKNRYRYDFTGLQSAMSRLRSSQDTSTLNRIQKELDKFFKDSKCLGVIYTKNTDKMFFGMCTMAVLNSVHNTSTADILLDDKSHRIQQYYIEIDSKLIDNLNLSKEELTSIILHEVGHLVNDSSPIGEVRKAIDDYMVSQGEVLSLSDSVHFRAVLEYGIKDTLRKVTSIFNRYDDEILADEFVFMCGYGEHLETAFAKIVRSSSTINRGVANRLIVLTWSLHLYKNMKLGRIRALSTLNKTKRYTASKLEKKEIETLIDSLSRIDDIALQETVYIIEEASKKNTLIKRIQRNGLKSIEDDSFEYEMRIRNVEDEDDALLIIRQINMRMSILDDYIQNSDDIGSREIQRWQKTFDKYDKLRNELSKKTVYYRKNYGIWMDYNYTGMENR